MNGAFRVLRCLARAAALACCGAAVLLACGAWASLPAFAGEVPVAWQLLDDGDLPATGATQIPGAYDTGRQRAIAVPGGSSSVQSGAFFASSTWELIGEDWVRRFPAGPVPGVVFACAAFDESRNVLVGFGGGAAGDTAVFTNETWEYDGNVWVKRELASSPPARGDCMLVYDSVRRVLVLFGGMKPDAITAYNDTWEYDGTAWRQIQTQAWPAARARAGMVFDRDRGVTVLFGGMKSDWSLLSDTWQYDGLTWTQKFPHTSPPARHLPGMTYDPVRKRTVLFGGNDPALGEFNDTWEYDGRRNRWTQMSPLESPGPRHSMTLVYDTARGKVLGFGGDWSDRASFSETWTYDGTTWTRIALSGLPLARFGFGLAYDPFLQRTVLYGGDRYGTADEWLWDTWHFDGRSWTEQTAAGSPTFYRAAPLAFDPARGAVVGFGGQGLSSPVNDLHEYGGDPRQWTSTPNCPAPSCPDPRVKHGWTYAPDFGGVLLFGGSACCTELGSWYDANDTWVLTPAGWERHFPLHSPQPRAYLALAFDTKRRRAVLYGGDSPVTDFSDTWAYDGTDWQQLFATSPPGPRLVHSLVYDPVRDRVVLFGDAPDPEDVTWEFDGIQWIARPTPFHPDENRGPIQMAYDAEHEAVILFGGSTGILWNDTWAYGADPDGDGIVGGFDNCRAVANGSQEDGDADGAGDACDCAPADPTAFAVPAEVTGLLLAADKTTLSWESAAPGAGSGTVHDVVRGVLAELPVGSGGQEICLASGIAASSTTDAASPSEGAGFWYLVRGRNVCGAGTYGFRSDATERATAACP